MNGGGHIVFDANGWRAIEKMISFCQSNIHKYSRLGILGK